MSGLAIGLSNPLGPLHVQMNGTSNVFLVNSNALIGIGKSNPVYALDVVGEINASSNIRISGQSLQGLGVPNQVVFTSGSSTWSVPTGVTAIQVEMVGGGGL